MKTADWSTHPAVFTESKVAALQHVPASSAFVHAAAAQSVDDAASIKPFAPLSTQRAVMVSVVLSVTLSHLPAAAAVSTAAVSLGTGHAKATTMYAAASQ